MKIETISFTCLAHDKETEERVVTHKEALFIGGCTPHELTTMFKEFLLGMGFHKDIDIYITTTLDDPPPKEFQQ
jgi:hypothetical protein